MTNIFDENHPPVIILANNEKALFLSLETIKKTFKKMLLQNVQYNFLVCLVIPKRFSRPT